MWSYSVLAFGMHGLSRCHRDGHTPCSHLEAFAMLLQLSDKIDFSTVKLLCD